MEEMELLEESSVQSEGGNEIDLMESFKINSGPKIREQIRDSVGRSHGVGRRKSSVAKAWVREGSGNFLINKRQHDKYFVSGTALSDISKPLEVIKQKFNQEFDIIAFCKGGGLTGQSGALMLAISRALVAYNPEYYATLRSYKLMTTDERKVQRKLAGLVKARKAKPTSRR